MKKNTHIGIWVDKKEAFLISLDKNDHEVVHMESEIETFNPKGGYGGSVKHGPSDAINEKSYLAREEKQKKGFFKNLVEFINRDTYLYIFGPAQMKNDLHKFIKENMRPQPLSISIDNADSMTKNQLVAKVKNHFERR